MLGKKKRRIWLPLAVLLAGTVVAALDARLAVRHYRLETARVSAPVRIALLTDLHSCDYGEGQAGLLKAVAAEGPDVVLLGGSFQHDAEANVGPLTKLGLSQFSVDKCFIGADAISEEKGVSTINLFRAEVVRSMSESAGKMIVLTTSDKIGGSAVASVVPLDHLHTLITDTDIKPADQHMLERAGVNVLTV